MIPEAALRLRVGTPELRQAQYRHLLELTELPNVTIQVVRPENGSHLAISSSPFYVLDFAQARPFAYVELLDGARYIQDPDEVRTYTMAAEDVRRVALPPDKSLAFVRSLIKAR